MAYDLESLFRYLVLGILGGFALYVIFSLVGYGIYQIMKLIGKGD